MDLSKSHQTRGKKEKPVKKQKSNRAKIKARIEELARKLILKIDDFKNWDDCKGVSCWNHLITKTAGDHVRWIPLNIFCGSMGANNRHEYDYTYMVNWFKNKYGDRVYDELVKYSHSGYKLTMSDLEDIETFWINMLKPNNRIDCEQDWFFITKIYSEGLRQAWEEYSNPDYKKCYENYPACVTTKPCPYSGELNFICKNKQRDEIIERMKK